MFQKVKDNTKGFTLIEVMVVIIMVGILASIAFPMYLNHAKKAKMVDAIMEVKSVASYIMEKKMAGKTPGAVSTFEDELGLRQRYFIITWTPGTDPNPDNFIITATVKDVDSGFTHGFQYTYKNGFEETNGTTLHDYAEHVLNE